MDRNRRTRGVVRSAVTRTLTQIDNLLQDENTTELDSLRLQLGYLLQIERDLIRLDHDTQTSTSDNDLEDELEGAEEYRLRISHSLTRVRHALYSHVSVPQPTNITPNVPLQNPVRRSSSDSDLKEPPECRPTETADTDVCREPSRLAGVLGSFQLYDPHKF